MHEILNNRCLHRERNLVKGFLILVFLVVAHFVHNEYFAGGSLLQPPLTSGNTPSYYIFKAAPLPLHAPEAYRVALPALGCLLVRVFHVHDPAYIAAALDFLFGTLAAYLLYLVAVSGLAHAKARDRALVVVFFLAFLQFATPWVIPWLRPETLPTALFLAMALLCLTRSRQGIVWTLALLSATAAQSFVRADVPFVFGLAIVFASFITLGEFGSRLSNLLKGITIVAISSSVQFYLQFIRFPHLSYWPGTSVIQLRANLGLHNLSNCILALLPFILVGAVLIFKRIHVDSIDAVIIMASAIYLVFWFTVGIIDEVRIYVPFLMALCVVAAKLSASQISQCIRATDNDEPVLPVGECGSAAD
jgi:hypothetical protein